MTLTTDLLALVILGLLALGTGLMAVLTVLPASRRVALDAWPILGTEFIIIGVGLGALWSGGWVLALALALHGARVAYEVWATAAPPKWQVLLFPGLPLALFTWAGAQDQTVLLLLAFLMVETFDSYALLGGKLCGRTKAFPRLSPNKTVEGLLIGAAMLMLTVLGGAWALAQPLLPALGLALAAAALAVTGDLLASRIKRQAGVKDYPKILPRQGGLFDITDAWVTTSAGFVVLWTLF